MLVTVDDDGRATRIAGDPEHPFTQVVSLHEVSKYLERTYTRPAGVSTDSRRRERGGAVPPRHVGRSDVSHRERLKAFHQFV